MGGGGGGEPGRPNPHPSSFLWSCLPERNRVPGPHQGPRGRRNAWDMPAVCICRVAALDPWEPAPACVCGYTHESPRCCGKCLIIASLPAPLPRRLKEALLGSTCRDMGPPVGGCVDTCGSRQAWGYAEWGTCRDPTGTWGPPRLLYAQRRLGTLALRGVMATF